MRTQADVYYDVVMILRNRVEVENVDWETALEDVNKDGLTIGQRAELERTARERYGSRVSNFPS
jgi:hypothetical protein